MFTWMYIPSPFRSRSSGERRAASVLRERRIEGEYETRWMNYTWDQESMRWLKSEPTMLVGMDVTHRERGTLKGTPSIAAVVASTNRRRQIGRDRRTLPMMLEYNPALQCHDTRPFWMETGRMNAGGNASGWGCFCWGCDAVDPQRTTSPADARCRRGRTLSARAWQILSASLPRRHYSSGRL